MKLICVIVILILVGIYYILFNRKLYHSNIIIKGNEQINANKLMIVAHPDDELIFAGKELLKEKGWKVICVTNGSSKSENKFSFTVSPGTRKKEFIDVMNMLGCQYEMWDYEDNGFNANWDELSLLDKLRNAINENEYKIILTHNLNGEYGHVQHKKISELIHLLKPKNFYVFGYSETKNLNSTQSNSLDPNIIEINKLLSLYKSQRNTINKHYTYINNQTICKVDFLTPQ
ncbi:hypothetical protein QJ856_gp0805 [Tupanvirus deep ocean]|uniref:Uncharacterized protein n=2 Tax=Tupanvirus TaxID=2094720 RepID=A0AC62A8H1_9VIRU|nr:hypothetical protein QJ856_gp0805 [Tupanvirus deep ocean]QKU33948.1 hypothetical protein [Tupanvirus deep ocean]